MTFIIKLHKSPEAEQARHKQKKHTTVPLIESPLVGADQEEAVFHQRHESNTIELFFDLFFAANLATFTAYHPVTDARALWSYVGFFAILWTSWFSISLHDVRFSRDSIYERACKTVQMICFVGFALVGSKFSPNREAKSNVNFRILCFTLIISRALLGVQYLVVLGFTVARKGFNKLYLPLSLNAAVYFIAAGAFGAMTPAFTDESKVSRAIYSVWWIVMLCEIALTIFISSNWRMLSFKKTHLVERMGLLTLIVIGEGAIGVTKTISAMMGKYGLDPEGSAATLCYVLILVLIWMLYFDNHPKHHFGTITQQVWSSLHFIYHLCIVGVVEGARQMALARYTLKNTQKIQKYIETACYEKNMDGAKLSSYLDKALDYFQLESKVESARYASAIDQDIWKVGNATGICSPSNLDSLGGFFPQELADLYQDSVSALYASLGMKIPLDKPANVIAEGSWHTVYVYFWSAFLLLLLSSIVFLILTRRNRADLSDYIGLVTRSLGAVIAVGFLTISNKPDLIIRIMSTPAVLPSTVGILLLILFFDHFTRILANFRLKKSGAAFDEDTAEEHHEAHGHTASHHAHSHSHHSFGDLMDEKNAARPSVTPLQNTDETVSSSFSGYNPVPTVMHSHSYSYSTTSGPMTPGSQPPFSPGMGQEVLSPVVAQAHAR